MQKKLILNADDYGWDQDANDGILDLIESGKMSNVSILANHCDSSTLKNIRKHQSSVSFGLHVCLNEGKAVSTTTQSSIYNEERSFYTSKELFTHAVLGKVKYADIFNEIKAQYEYLKDHDIEITHADSHQHIHQYPFLSGMITQALHEIGIQKIRNCMPYTIYDQRRIILNGFCLVTRNNLKAFKHPDILVTDFTDLEISFIKRVPEILKSLHESNYQTIEWMCHPALKDKKDSYLKRRNEYDFLKECDWDILLKNLPIELSQYKFI